MKVLAINSSPHMDGGNTGLILTPFLEGMREAGAELEVYYTKELRINPCTGEHDCWKRSGKCYQDDDMRMLYPKLDEADVWVLATPLYVDGPTGPMKNLIDRLAPRTRPFLELRDGNCRHPLAEGTRRNKVVLVSSCGLWELDNFDPLVLYMTALCRNIDSEFVGALLRPHAPAFNMMLKAGLPVGDIVDAAKRAGARLMSEGRMSAEDLARISRPLVPRDAYIQGANQRFKQMSGGTGNG